MYIHIDNLIYGYMVLSTYIYIHMYVDEFLSHGVADDYNVMHNSFTTSPKGGIQNGSKTHTN